MSVEYPFAIQQYRMTVLLETSADMSVMLQFFSSPQKPKLLKSDTCTVTSASDTDLGPVGQCFLTFKVRKQIFHRQVH